MPSVDIWFDPSTAIPYLVGAPSCAVPGVVAGLAEGHRRLGRLPWAELFAPAIEIARAGVPISAAQARLHTLLDPILRLEPEGRRLYGADGPLGAGEEPDLSDLATTFEILARDGADAFYRGELAHAMLACVREGGGRLTAEDLASFRAVRRRPIRAAFRDTEFMTCPPSSAGGVLIAFALSVLDRLGPPAAAGSAEQVSRLAEVMREATLARGGSFVRDLGRGGLAGRLLETANVEAAAQRARAGGPAASESLGLPSTTHVSVVDADGNVASLSASTGAGSGVIVAGTGIHLNNMLGESDLHALATTASPGKRLASMMAPSLVLRGDEPRLVIGSAGSARLRSAILQTVVNVIDHGQDVREAIAAPRVHLEDGLLNVEEGIDPAELDGLERRGYDVARWAPGNVFFGGVSAVTVAETGELAAAGDPRRGGAGAVVA